MPDQLDLGDSPPRVDNGAEILVSARNHQLESSDYERTFPAFAVFLLLVCADAGFTLLHLISVETGWLRAARISLEADGGPAEIFQYLKEFWVVVCMAVAFVSTRRAVYASWALVFLFLLADDSMLLHENVGTWLGERYAFPTPFGMRSKDVGELLFAATAGLVTLALVGVAAWRGTEQCRRVARDLGILIVSLGLVGILLDVVHVIAYFGESLLAQVLLVMEDGGEMIIMSAMTAYAFHIATHWGRTRFDLWSLVKVRLASSVSGSWRSEPAYLKPRLDRSSVSPVNPESK